MKGKIIGKSIALIAVLLISSIGAAVPAAEFTATVNDHEGDKIRTSRITVKGLLYRLDVEEEGQKLFVIVDQEKKITRIVVPSEKMYMEIPSHDFQSLMNDPFQALKYTIATGESKPAGTETVNGHECDKYLISMYNENVMTQWVSKKLDFPVKIEYHLTENKFVELTDISEGAVDDALFLIPEGYSVWVDPADLPAEVPEWAKDLESAPVMTPPFEKTMTAGEIIRVPVVPGKSVWSKAVDQSEDANAKAIPFKDGRPLKEPSNYNNIAEKGFICDRRNETSHEADEIVFYVYKGSFTAKVKPFDMHEKRLVPGEEFRFPVETWDHVEARYANGGDEKAVCLVSFFNQDGEDISESPEDYRLINLDKPKDYKTRTYSPDIGNEVVITVKTGSVVVKMGQYDAFKF